MTVALESDRYIHISKFKLCWMTQFKLAIQKDNDTIGGQRGSPYTLQQEELEAEGSICYRATDRTL